MNWDIFGFVCEGWCPSQRETTVEDGQDFPSSCWKSTRNRPAGDDMDIYMPVWTQKIG